MEKKQRVKIMCPSSRCKPGAQLLGVRLQNGEVAILPQTLPVDEQFIENTRNGSIPEERFRFVNKCVENGCRQWTGTRCGIADTIENACRICPYVITEITETEVNEFFADEKNIVLRVDV